MNNGNCCRTCLGDASVNAIDLDSDRNIEYYDIIHRFTGYKMKINDPLPQTVCTMCVGILNQVVSFRNTCQRSHNVLLERLNRQVCNVKSEPKLLIHNVNSSFSRTVGAEDRNNSVIRENDNGNESFSDNDNYDDEVDKTVTNNQSEEFVEFESTIEEILKKGIPFTFQKNKCTKRKKVQKKYKKETENEAYKNRRLNITKDLIKRQEELKINSLKRETKLQEAETESQFQCEYCFKVYCNKVSYLNHIKIHTGLKVICEHCGKEFLDKRRLLMHCRSKHGYQKTDKCTYCDYLGISPESVKIHERIHTGEKPYKCKECPASFHRSSSYLQHTARHLPEKTVQCQQCPALFKSVTLMRIHANRHKPRDHKFKCLVCGGNFSSRSSVGRHLRRAHAVARCTQAHLQRVKLNEP